LSNLRRSTRRLDKIKANEIEGPGGEGRIRQGPGENRNQRSSHVRSTPRREGQAYRILQYIRAPHGVLVSGGCNGTGT
jgi:hypothetical protein